MTEYKTILSTWTVSLPDHGEVVFRRLEDLPFAGFCETETDYKELLEKQGLRVKACAEYRLPDFDPDEFEQRFHYDHKVFCTDEKDLHIIELNARQEELSHKRIPLSSFPDGYLYIAQGSVYEDQSESIFLRSNLLVDVFTTKDEALAALREKYFSYIEQRILWEGYEDEDEDEHISDREKNLPSYRFWISKVSPNRYPVILNENDQELRQWYDPASIDRSSPDALYHELMRLVQAETTVYSASFRPMVTLWQIGPDRQAYKSYEDFIHNSRSEFAAGDYVQLDSRYEPSIRGFPSSDIIGDLLYREQEIRERGRYYYSGGSYFVLNTMSRNPILECADPLFWSRSLALEGMDRNDHYVSIRMEDVPEFMCARLPDEEVEPGSFLELTRELVMTGGIPSESHRETLEQGLVELIPDKYLPYTDLKLFQELLQERQAAAAEGGAH